MIIDEQVFRHEVLDTTTLDHFMSLKQTSDVCHGELIPFTCGVFPADETPIENSIFNT